MNSESLPHTWIETRLDEISEVILGQSPPGSSYNTDGIGLPFFQGSAEFGPLFPEVRKWTTEPTKVAQAGDVLLSVRAPVGPTNLAPSECAIGRGIAALRAADGVEPKYILYAIRATEAILAARGTGSTFTAVSGPTVREHRVSLAPTGEQRRIVAAIEEHFSRIDAGIEALERARRNLRRMRTAIPAAAIRGRLNALAGRHSDETLDPSSQDTPADSRWLTVEELAERIADCEHSTPTFRDTGHPCVDTTCIEPGRIVLKRVRHVDESTYRKRVRRMVPEPGDIIFAREGTVGTAVVIPDGFFPCLGQRVMIIRPKPLVQSRYLEIALNSVLVRSQYLPLILGTTSPHLNVRDVRRLRIPVPSVERQEQIIAGVDLYSSGMSAVAEILSICMRRAEQLRRMVLDSAFKGCLVAQDPSDEPASVLLRGGQDVRATKGSLVVRRGGRKHG